MGTLLNIRDEIIARMEDLKSVTGTYIKTVYGYPNLTPTEYPCISLGYPVDPELGEQRTTARERRYIEYPVYLIVPQKNDENGYKAVLNAIDQVRAKFRVKGIRDNLNGKVSINRGIVRVETSEILSSSEFIVYEMTLGLVVLESLA